MTSSEEYLAKLGFDNKDLAKDADRAIDIISHIGNAFDVPQRVIEKFEASLDKVGGAGKNAASGTKASGKEAAGASAEWRKLTKELSDAQDAYKAFRQDQLTGNKTPGAANAPTGGAGARLLDINAAQGANVVSGIKDRVRALQQEEQAARDVGTAEARLLSAQAKDRAADALDAQRQSEARVASVNKAVSSAIADFQRETAARTQEYSKQASAAEDSYQRQERARRNALAETTFNQNSRRYAEPARASNNIANPVARAGAQEEYSNQQLKAMGDYYRAQEQISGSSKKLEGSTVTLRYALYDVATTYGVVGAAALGAAGYAVTVGAQFESAFTGVERTLQSGQTTDQIAAIRQQLVELSTQIPITFEELSRIATLGNQLGVPADQISAFTATVAKFSTVTGLSVDATAQAFGRLSNILGIPVTDAEKLGSSIALVGKDSASTEAEIVALTERLGATATQAGFTADQIIGLSARLGSLGVAPERAQGVFETYFNTLNTAVAEGGENLENFAKITGLTTGEVEQLVRSGQGFEVFKRFITTLNGAPDNPTLVTALQALGIEGLRANEVIPRLAANVGMLEKSFDIAAQGYGEGTELSRQFALVVDDLASQFQMLVNNLNALIETVSGGLVPGIAGALGLLNDFVTFLRAIAENPAAAEIGKFVVVATALVGALIAIKAASALATASSLALRDAQVQLQATGTRGGFVGLLGALTGIDVRSRNAAAGVTALGTGSRIAAGGVAVLSGAARLLGRLLVIGFLTEAVSLVLDLNNGSRDAAMTVAGIAGTFLDVAGAIAEATGQAASFFQMLNPVNAILGRTVTAQNEAIQGGKEGAQNTRLWKDQLNAWVGTFKKSDDGLGDVTASSYGAASAFGAGSDATGDFGGSLDDLGDSAAGAAAEVRTLVDYANDLGSVQTRAFEIRFGGDMAFDTISSGWNTISKSISDTNQQIADYRATMLSLTADKAIKEYWLSVAENYGDALRAGELRAELADIDNQLAKNSSDLSSAQQKNSGVLEGNSDAAIENRATLTGLVQNYQSYITALAASGASQADLTAKTNEARNQFIAQATALGFPIEQVLKYAAAFNDTATAIARVPRNITVSAYTDPAMQALAELEARARQVSSQTYSGPSYTGSGKSADIARLEATIEAQSAWAKQLAKEGNARGAISTTDYVGRLREELRNIRGYKVGGWTGGVGRDDVAGVVHGQEYVLNATGAQMFPRTMLDAANKGQSPFYAGAQKSKQTFPSVMMVEFSPIDRALIADGKNVTVMVGADQVGRAASSSYSDDSRRGGS